MFNSFVRAVSGLNPFGKAAETTNDIVVIPVGGMNEATLNNEGEPQQAPPERERRQVRGGRPNRRDLEVEEVYYEAEDSQDDLFANIRDVRQFENLENVREGYHRPRPGDVDARDRVWFHGTRIHGLGQCRDNFKRGKSHNGRVMYPLR